eukprot:GEMP01049039.1.p1 GENE.GEMP01049039.1~~GEMP01049039.1.p1  ORF type:complete len:216 (+),score=40.65 GEMP01049039.1:143-790(+)
MLIMSRHTTTESPLPKAVVVTPPSLLLATSRSYAEPHAASQSQLKFRGVVSPMSGRLQPHSMGSQSAPLRPQSPRSSVEESLARAREQVAAKADEEGQRLSISRVSDPRRSTVADTTSETVEEQLQFLNHVPSPGHRLKACTSVLLRRSCELAGPDSEIMGTLPADAQMYVLDTDNSPENIVRVKVQVEVTGEVGWCSLVSRRGTLFLSPAPEEV